MYIYFETCHHRKITMNEKQITKDEYERMLSECLKKSYKGIFYLIGEDSSKYSLDLDNYLGDLSFDVLIYGIVSKIRQNKIDTILL
jgi:hypothetical protein